MTPMRCSWTRSYMPNGNPDGWLVAVPQDLNVSHGVVFVQKKDGSGRDVWLGRKRNETRTINGVTHDLYDEDRDPFCVYGPEDDIMHGLRDWGDL